MKTTTDLHTREPFRWNDVAVAPYHELRVPARISKWGFVYLHPQRTPIALLHELNPDRTDWGDRPYQEEA